MAAKQKDFVGGTLPVEQVRRLTKALVQVLEAKIPARTILMGTVDLQDVELDQLKKATAQVQSFLRLSQTAVMDEVKARGQGIVGDYNPRTRV